MIRRRDSAQSALLALIMLTCIGCSATLSRSDLVRTRVLPSTEHALEVFNTCCATLLTSVDDESADIEGYEVKATCFDSVITKRVRWANITRVYVAPNAGEYGQEIVVVEYKNAVRSQDDISTAFESRAFNGRISNADNFTCVGSQFRNEDLILSLARLAGADKID